MRHIDTVTAIARSANARGYHFGAVIFNRRDVISVGWCQTKSHPMQARCMQRAHKDNYKSKNNFLHAEVHAIISAKLDVSGFDIIVGRYAEGIMKPSYPCKACQLAIEASGLRNIWFMDQNNKWVMDRVNG